MIVRADALATPATAFEADRKVLDDAIRQSQPGASALNLEQAFEFAQRAQKLQSQHAGEIVFAGAGRVPEEEAAFTAVPANLRVLPVDGRAGKCRAAEDRAAAVDLRRPIPGTFSSRYEIME